MQTSISSKDSKASHRDAGPLGLDASVRGVSLGELAEGLLDIAAAGLVRLDALDAPLLEPLRHLLVDVPLATALLREWEADGPEALLRRL